MKVNANTVRAAAHDPSLAAIWFPPYGNPGPQQNPSSDSKGGTDFASALKAHEDQVAELIGNLGDAERAIAYKYLYASGMRIGNVDEQLRKAIRKELRLD
jgi:hypothetical protein